MLCIEFTSHGVCSSAKENASCENFMGLFTNETELDGHDDEGI